MPATRFRDRLDAGRALLGVLDRATRLEDPVVLGLTRGGVPVAAEVAAGLHAPLDVLVARKVGAPGHEEYGIGAVAEGGVCVSDRNVLARLGLSDDEFARLAAREEQRVRDLVARYRAGRSMTDVRNRQVVLVDDGLATGVTAEAALGALGMRGPARLVLAIPVCASDSARRLATVADDVVCAHEPPQFHAVGAWYDRFDPTTDDEVLAALRSRSPA